MAAQKILVIDDSIATSRVTESVLSQNLVNCDVLLAQRARDGFERFQVAQPDLILLNESLPDMDGEAICYRLLNDAATASVPIVLMSSNGHAKLLQEKYANIVKTLPKPVTPDALLSAVSTTLSQARPLPHPSSAILFRDAAKITYAGHTGFFSLRSAMQMAYGDKLNGALRIFINRFPVELFISRGRFLFATTRNFQLYTRESPVILSSTNLGLVMEAQINQGYTGCPLFLYLATRSGFPHEDVVQITREHGQRLFSHLWTAGRINFEFEDMAQFPDYARNFPPTEEDPENWILASLRYVKYDALTASQRPDPNGSPAYTRKGYELIQRLKLNDVEARFATAINGAETLQSIAKKIGLPLNDALLIVFRFQSLDVIDYWSSTVLSLPAMQTNPAGEVRVG
jgi:CheY-like chemotaxis protein